MARFDGDAGAHPDRGSRLERGFFERIEVITQVFSWMGNPGSTGAFFEQFHAQHALMVARQMHSSDRAAQTAEDLSVEAGKNAVLE
jgi:hypothetical protein